MADTPVEKGRGTASMRKPLVSVLHLAATLAALGLVAAAFRWFDVSNPTIAALTFLLIVLVAAATSRLWVAVAASFAAMLSFNYFFLPPLGTLTIADPQNLFALFVFLIVSLVASNLSAAARNKAQEAQSRRDELTRLFDLSRDILLLTDHTALPGLARSMASRFGLDYAAIAIPRDGTGWQTFEAGPQQVALDAAVLDEAFAHVTGPLEFDARARTYTGHVTRTIGATAIRIVPLRVGTRPVGLFAAAGRPIDPGTLDVMAGIAAIAIERARFLEDRKAADMTRQSEELKSALLASIGHDLRTPLTAIRVAGANLRDTWLGETERRDQGDVILTEVERLTRLFENILSMARLDAGSVAAAKEWTLPSEIVIAAREQVEHALGRHAVDVGIEADEPIRLDPRLTATALAHVLENAAQYSADHAPIHVNARVTGGALTLSVHDAGAGIPPAELPHLFDRFYRGVVSKARTSGTGMGLAIARGLLAAEDGRIWVENDPRGGAIFTISVPIEVRSQSPDPQP